MTRRPPVAPLLAATLLTVSINAVADLSAARRLANQGEATAALQAVERHLRDQPDDVAGLFLRARLLASSGRTAEAIERYRRLAEEHPDRPEPRNNLAALYAARGDVEQARRELLAALATHPSYSTAFDNLQTLHARLASIAYRRALGNGEGEGAEPLHLATLPSIHAPATAPATTVAAAELASIPAPAAKPAPPAADPAGPASPADPAQSILKVVKGWAEAWSAKDVRRYLDHYAADFRPDELTHAQWRAQRNARLSKPRTIRVTLKELRIRITGANSAEALFEQSYSADNYADRVIKQLSLKRGADGWKIVAEQTLSVLG